ncbi:hypothetical protein C8R41DRAFT_920310 [Lentinula lateritia]|uniref:Uncharacterized protein n=1 Tax=Lentinula lateritia TaxID=40482 RepID=A0ABQ8VEL4_9AGAR|nr:hypothetical protein C8R41DRAFT_920310 [Lentinula lateritia]
MGTKCILTALSGSSLYCGHTWDSFIANTNWNDSSNNVPYASRQSTASWFYIVPFTLDKNDYGSTIQTANSIMRFKTPGTMGFAAVDGAVTRFP